MPAPKLKNIYGRLGKPIASSTPIKEIFDINEELFPIKEKKTNQEQCSRNHKMFKAGDQKPASTTRENKVVRYNLEIVSSDSESDSDIMPSKKTKIISPKANRPVAASSINTGARDIGKKKQLEKAHVKGHKVGDTTLGDDKDVAADSNAITSRNPGLRKKIDESCGSSAPSSGVFRGVRVAQRPKGNLRIENDSSSDDSENNTEDLKKHNERSLRDTRKSHSRQKCNSATMSPAKIITKTLTVDLSSDFHKQNKDSENALKKITTPVTGMPPARARQSLCRTLSRISASASEKFMVEIPKSLADSFSASLQLIKRRIDFELIDEPKKKQRLDVTEKDMSQNESANSKDIEKNKYRDGKKGERKRDMLLSRWKSPPTATFPRKITALKPVSSPEKELDVNDSKTAIKGVRKSMRSRTAPISYWKGPNSETEDGIFSQNKPRKKSNSLASSTSNPPNEKNHLKKNSSLQVNKIKDSTKQIEKTEPGKRFQQKEDRGKVPRKSSANQTKVCCSTFSQSVFVPSDIDEEDGDEIGVQYATSLQTFDMQSEFIRLLPGAKTTDLLSHNYNQLYTVLENTVCLYAEDVPKQFNLHSQFYVNKGVSHRLHNDSSESSLLLQVIIQK